MQKFPKRIFVVGLSGIALLATVVFGTSTASASMPGVSRQVLVGMGDSFTAGEGAPGYGVAWEKRPYDTEVDGCHRSTVSYVRDTARAMRNVTARNVACSGATTDDLFRSFRGEPAQVARLQGATDIVLTIGGNDIDALDSVQHPPPASELAAQLASLAPKLVRTYSAVRASAPNARLHVMGYPILFAAGETDRCPLTTQQRGFLIQAQTALNGVIRMAAATAGAHYVDVADAFAGHELCAPVSFVNGVNAAHPEYALHPDQTGQCALAAKLEASLRSVVRPLRGSPA
jgi:lysophospholipase L1-like esterase